ncbi:MAG: hypothetical protein GX632_03565 [Propioniciclava sp.]|nr:hypothetical protein [Propioniciclava sp.]
MAWALLPHDTPVGDLVGRSVVARGTVEGSSEVVLAARVTRLGDDVVVRWSTLSARTDPLLAAAQRALGQEPAHDPAKEAEVHRLPAGATIGAALLAATDVHVERVAVADVRWPWRTQRTLAVGLAVAAVLVTAVMTWLAGDPSLVGAWATASGASALLLYFQVADSWQTRQPSVREGDARLAPTEVAARLDAALAGPSPAERVAVVTAAYGALLGDIVYRIENSALFDAAVEQTQRFQLALVAWEPEAGEAGALASEVEESFAAARRHAESLGLAHLPETARDPARRAVHAAGIALATDQPGERAASARRAADLLRSLALYYLPVVDPDAPSLVGARRELTR